MPHLIIPICSIDTRIVLFNIYLPKQTVKKNMGYFDLYATQAQTPPPPPSSVLDPPPEIDFFDVSDDLEQKKKIFFLVQKNFWTCKIFQKSQKKFFLENVRRLPRSVRNVQKLPRRVRKRPETAPQG